jgi:hypothetical protein
MGRIKLQEACQRQHVQRPGGHPDLGTFRPVRTSQLQDLPPPAFLPAFGSDWPISTEVLTYPGKAWLLRKLHPPSRILPVGFPNDCADTLVHSGCVLSSRRDTGTLTFIARPLCSASPFPPTSARFPSREDRQV